jgi:hypothetical protein
MVFINMIRIISYAGLNGDTIVAQGTIKKSRANNFIEFTSDNQPVYHYYTQDHLDYSITLWLNTYPTI